MGVSRIVIYCTEFLLIDSLCIKTGDLMNTQVLGSAPDVLKSVKEPCVKHNNTVNDIAAKLVKSAGNRV